MWTFFCFLLSQNVFLFIIPQHYSFTSKQKPQTLPPQHSVITDLVTKMAVSTQKRLLLDAVNFLLTLPSRRERNEILGNENERRELLPAECLKDYELFRKREYLHISHVRACHSAIVLEKHKEADIPQHLHAEVENLGISLHDHTKDEFYFFVTTL